MTSPLCPPCSRLHELVREWGEADAELDAEFDAHYSEFDGGDSQKLDDAQRRYDASCAALSAAAQQLPDAAAHGPDVPAGNATAKQPARTRVADAHPARHARYDVWRDETGHFVATPCYGMHEPWWVPLVADLYEPGAIAFAMRDDDLWAPQNAVPTESCPAGSPQTDHGASIAACAQQDRYPLLYALIQSGADVCAAIEAVLTERT